MIGATLQRVLVSKTNGGIMVAVQRRIFSGPVHLRSVHVRCSHGTSAFLLLLALAGCALADMLPSQSFTAVNDALDCIGPFCGDSLTFNATQFNPSLGTLLSVGYQFADMETEVFTTGGSASVTDQAAASSPFMSPLPISAQASATEDVSCSTGQPFCFGNTISVLFRAGGTAFSDQFIGTGTVAIEVLFNSTLSQVGDSFAHGDFGGDQGILTVQYSFSPVAEPNERWLGFLALALCVHAHLIRQLRRGPLR